MAESDRASSARGAVGMRRCGRAMNGAAGIARTAVVVLVALAVNVALDVAFDLPMLVRWAVALVVVLALTALLETGRRRRSRQQLDPSSS